MATNLRLDPELEAALRGESDASGRSQQEVIRTALRSYLSARDAEQSARGRQGNTAHDKLISPRRAYERARTRIDLPYGRTSLDLLDRDDRL